MKTPQQKEKAKLKKELADTFNGILKNMTRMHKVKLVPKVVKGQIRIGEQK